MGFHIEEETIMIPKKIKHAYGPCLICGSETEYGKRIGQLGLVWLEKQFEPKAWLRNKEAVLIGVAPKDRSLRLLEELICEVCRAGLSKVRWAAHAERDAKLRRRAQARDRYHAWIDTQREREGGD
jgi:hypothetical protein